MIQVSYEMLFQKDVPVKPIASTAGELETTGLADTDWIPQYQSVKHVHAFKIESITLVSGGYLLSPKNSQCGVLVDKAYFDKHQPKTDGYYVRYEDGYQSWSPAAAFESGYVLLREGHDASVPSTDSEKSNWR